jgi:uncharacterized protein (TIGR02594 family)
MHFQLINTVFLKINPDPTAANVSPGRVLANEIGQEIERGADDLWIKISVPSPGGPRIGWALASNLKEVAAPARPEFNLVDILKTCVDAEAWINGQLKSDSFFVAADYLVALAEIETRIKNVGNKTPGSDAAGMFQISSKDWAIFIADPLGQDHAGAAFDDPFNQIFCVAFLTRKDMEAFTAAVAAHDSANGDTQTSGPAGPFVPSYVDILLARMVGVPAAVECRIRKLKNQEGSALDAALLAVGVAQDEVNRLLSHRAAFFRKDGSGEAENIEGMYIKLSGALTKAFEKAALLIQQQIPEDAPKPDGKAIWLDLAKAEKEIWEQQQLQENVAPGKTRVLDYFKTIRFPSSRNAPVEPWCGAFVGHCVAKAGLKPVNDAARAANWKSWGNVGLPIGSGAIPEGAVMVLTPEKGSGRSGHVGFFLRHLDDQFVEILGGNQSGVVKPSKYARSKVVAVRWFSDARDEEQAAAESALSSTSDPKFGKLLDFIGKFESGSNYNAFFGKTRNTDNPRFTGMKVNEVLAWQDDFVRNKKSPSSAVGKYQFVRGTLNALRSKGIAKANDEFEDGVQDRLAIALLKRRGLDRFLAGLLSEEEFGIHVAMEWASMPVPRDVRKDNGKTVRKGQSYYAGDGLNMALVSVRDFLDALRSVR